MQKKILFVCLGNICRSPAAEAVFKFYAQEIGLDEEFIVDSAGTGGWHVGKKADSRMMKAAFKRGIEITSYSRQINLEDFDKFDLILTMDNTNLEDVLSLGKETGVKYRASVKAILNYATNTNLIEVPDPYYGGENGFENVLDLLEDAVHGLLNELRD